MATDTETKEPPFPDKFEATDRGEDWAMKCKYCGKRWAMKKQYGTAPLFLLNHWYSHFPDDDDDDDFDDE